MINWISTKEVSKLPETERAVIVLLANSEVVHTAKFMPDIGWQVITHDRELYTNPSVAKVNYWSDYNLPK